MKYYHFCNDFSLDLDLTSNALGSQIDPSLLRSVKFFTRKNGRVYICTYGNNTLINNGDTVTCVMNNHGLEPGVLQYVCEFQIPDQTYPDFYKKIHQFYVSDIELVKGNGEQLEVDVEAMFGTTIDGKFNNLEANIDEVSEEVDVISANIVSIQERNSVQDASINHIEDIIATIDGGTSETIERLDTSVNALQSDVTSLNSTVDSLQADTENIATGLTETTNKVDDVSTRVDNMENVLGRKADSSVLSNYYTKDETYNKDEVDRAIADAAMDGSLPQGIVIDNNYVHTDNNYTNADKAKVRDFDLSLYPTNASLIENYATKAELQSVDDNHPTNASVNATYLKKTELANELTDYVQNASLVANYATKEELTDYVQNASLVANYATKEELQNIDLQDYYTKEDVSLMLAAKADVSNGWVDQNGNYNGQEIRAMTVQAINGFSIGDPADVGTGRNGGIGLFNLDHTLMITDMTQDSSHNVLLEYKFPVTTPGEPFVHKQIATIDYTYSQDAIDQLLADIQNQQTEDGELITDLSTNIKQLNNNLETNYVSNASLSDKVNNLNLTTYVKNASLNETLGNYVLTSTAQNTYTTKDEFNEVWTTFITGEQADETYAKIVDVSNNLTPDDISTFITENDASVFATSTDISTFKPIVFCTQQEYDALVENDDVDANTVYMLSGDQINYLTANDVSIFVTNSSVSSNYALKSEIQDFVTNSSVSSNYALKSEIQDFVTENDASIYLTDNDVSVYATTSYVDTQIGNIQNILETI